MNPFQYGKGMKRKYCMRAISEEVDEGDIGHVHDPLRFHRVSWNCSLIHGLDGSEMKLVTSSFSLLSKPILDLFQIQWIFHRVHLG